MKTVKKSSSKEKKEKTEYKTMKDELKNRKNEKTKPATSTSLPKQKIDYSERAVKDVPFPASTRLTMSQVFDINSKPKIDIIKQHFKAEGRLNEDVALKIIHEAKSLLEKEKNLIYIPSPVTIVGDIHGQYFDLLKIFDLGGDPATTKYLFLGDYVDRGYFSIECLLHLYALKILYPQTFILLRGNHECRHLTENFTFRKECLIKYSLEIYNACMDSFDALPLVAVINNQFLCVHGGISPETHSVTDLNRINRFQEPPASGHMCDLLWADPLPEYGNEGPKSQVAFHNNSSRGCSYFYTFNAVSEFLKNNNLLSIIRAHEAQDEGIKTFRSLSQTSFPSLITLFSAPNYLDVYNNKGAIIIYDNNLLNTKQFTCAQHPYWLPNFMDVFTWSLPFIVEKVTEMFVCILNVIDDEEDHHSPDRRMVIKQKLLAISHIAQMFSKIREESEALIELKGIAPSKSTPLSSLIGPANAKNTPVPVDARNMLGNDFTGRRRLSFEEVKELDKPNEQYPRGKN